ncbi:MAG TPA: DinB family protein, partial [Acidobacteriota bacterium]|nr:DinB family protein [Acidobacteriota bacterium]
MILEHGESQTFVPFDRTAMLKLPQDRPLAEMLDEFYSLRASNIKILKDLKLDAQKIAKKGRHPELGTVTLEQLISTWVVHDLGHLAQITRVMAKQYTDEVGPWRAYLPVLDTRLK